MSVQPYLTAGAESGQLQLNAVFGQKRQFFNLPRRIPTHSSPLPKSGFRHKYVVVIIYELDIGGVNRQGHFPIYGPGTGL